MLERSLKDAEAEAHPHGLLAAFKAGKEAVDPYLIAFTIISSFLIVVAASKMRIFQLWSDFLNSTMLLKYMTYPLIASGLFILFGLLFRTYLWFQYKPETLEEGEELDWPLVSVVIPAFNEEETVGQTVDSVMESNYPRDRIEVICINDGSIDRTLDHMRRARDKYAGSVRVINFVKNQGKRRALYSGFKSARGRYVVSVDSDSKIGRNALRNVLLPLIRDPEVGAVAGRVGVLNEKDNFLTRMMTIRYGISFDFGRAYQSVYGTVFTCPGALTAYRRSVLRKFMRDWANQTFLGVPCTYGEDRALTTNVLRLGYQTRYQSNAVVYTKVPTTIHSMNRMYLRWSRSMIRESILFAQFMFGPYRETNRFLPVFDFLFLNILYPFQVVSLMLLAYAFFINPLFLLRQMAFLVMISFLLSMYYLKTNKSLTFIYGIPYGMITAFLLWWITPYAALTMKNRSWLTK
ncbi:MAG: glycosyltransferase family 2 protein [Candidatus Aminicenantes bacterium]|nr:glycosyltransferase family 2 protein [Candidatus Aminicenantes bacterium]